MSDPDEGYNEAIYVKVVLLDAPTENEDGSFHIPVAVEHTQGLPLAYVVSLLKHAAEALSGG